MTGPADVSRPEGSLLLYCLGIRPKGLGRAHLPSLTVSDSAEILRQAGENGITSLLYHRLRTVVPAPELPPAVIEHLRRVAVSSAAQSLQIGRELSQILEVFRRHGVAVVALKGAHLGNIVYGSAALRTMGDLDLMVRRDQLGLAEGLLTQLGYTPQQDPLEPVDYARHHHTRPLGKPGAVRAVGRACATNPVALVIPCHRVVREDKCLGGYRWGLERKKKLLEKERGPQQSPKNPKLFS